MNSDLLKTLVAEALPSEALFFDEPMSAHTTFRVGGPADVFAEPSSAEQVQACLQAAQSADAPWRILGCGSNVLVADEGVRGLVIHLGERFSTISVEGELLRASAGATNEMVAKAALEAGLSGYEFASGIPGSVGGAAFMNAGAYDGEFKDVCMCITCLDPKGNLVRVDVKDAGLSYRHSIMMDEGYVVLEVVLRLSPADKEVIAQRMDDLAKRRSEKQPLDMGSAGSTFKRPEGYFAGKLIEEAGMRGYTVGGAQVSKKHCGFVVNTGSATAQDVHAVIRGVQDAVLKTSGVLLEPEVRFWG